MTGAKPVKVARDGVVTVGSGTAIILTFLAGREPDEGESDCERASCREALGKAIDDEGAGAAWEENTGGVTRTDDEQAGDAARRTSVSRSVGLVGVGMVAGGSEGMKETNLTEDALKEIVR